MVINDLLPGAPFSFGFFLFFSCSGGAFPIPNTIAIAILLGEKPPKPHKVLLFFKKFSLL